MAWHARVVVVRTLAFVVVRRLLGLIGMGPAPDAKDVEIAVLRHQLMVLRRQPPGLYLPRMLSGRGQAACSYLWRMPPRRSCRWMFRWVSRCGSVIGAGSGVSGQALAML